MPCPPDLSGPLSHPSLDAVKRSAGALQLGTLGGGNHFVEFQADEDDRLWLMIHSGSRAMGQAIRAHHLARRFPRRRRPARLDADTDAGRAYAADVAWARRYADANRRAMADAAADVCASLFGVAADERRSSPATTTTSPARSISAGCSGSTAKGRCPPPPGRPGVLPGSMGSASYHVEGRGCADSLCSSATAPAGR